MIIVLGPRDKKIQGLEVISTVSHSITWSKGFSPFVLGPIKLPDGHYAMNFENAWQYSKVYKCHVGDDGYPNKDWFIWSRKGFDKRRADRYPMGKGAIPEYSWWNNQKLNYIEARKKIYIPQYRNAVDNVACMSTLELKHIAKLANNESLGLFDFDGYNHRSLGMSYDDVINDPTRKMGHAFVLAMMVENYKPVWDF
jgi:hypothetical protein